MRTKNGVPNFRKGEPKNWYNWKTKIVNRLLKMKSGSASAFSILLFSSVFTWRLDILLPIATILGGSWPLFRRSCRHGVPINLFRCFVSLTTVVFTACSNRTVWPKNAFGYRDDIGFVTKCQRNSIYARWVKQKFRIDFNISSSLNLDPFAKIWGSSLNLNFICMWIMEHVEKHCLVRS